MPIDLNRRVVVVLRGCVEQGVEAESARVVQSARVLGRQLVDTLAELGRVLHEILLPPGVAVLSQFGENVLDLLVVGVGEAAEQLACQRVVVVVALGAVDGELNTISDFLRYPEASLGVCRVDGEDLPVVRAAHAVMLRRQRQCGVVDDHGDREDASTGIDANTYRAPCVVADGVGKRVLGHVVLPICRC